MEWYRYNPETFEYEHPVICQDNPVRPEKFLIPPSSTPKKPSAAGEKQIAVFDVQADQWSIKPDYRGIEYWLPDGTHHKIETIGETPPDNALYQQPEPLPDKSLIEQQNAQARLDRELIKLNDTNPKAAFKQLLDNVIRNKEVIR